MRQELMARPSGRAIVMRKNLANREKQRKTPELLTV